MIDIETILLCEDVSSGPTGVTIKNMLVGSGVTPLFPFDWKVDAAVLFVCTAVGSDKVNIEFNGSALDEPVRVTGIIEINYVSGLTEVNIYPCKAIPLKIVRPGEIVLSSQINDGPMLVQSAYRFKQSPPVEIKGFSPIEGVDKFKEMADDN